MSLQERRQEKHMVGWPWKEREKKYIVVASRYAIVHDKEKFEKRGS
jgi:hypothetical protein